jgi:hypothetical protein
LQGLREAYEILRNYANEAMTRAIDVSYEKERDTSGSGYTREMLFARSRRRETLTQKGHANEKSALAS